MSRKKRTSPRSGAGRRTARAQQVQRDLLRFERPFDEWSADDIDVDPPLELVHLVDELCVAFVLMPGTPRPVTGFNADELHDLLDALDDEDRTGETGRHVAAALDAWTVFLLQTGRWSAGEDESWDVREVLRRLLTPPEPLLDEPSRARLAVVVDGPVDHDQTVAALEATRPVRQANRIRDWVSANSVEVTGLGVLDDVTDDVVVQLDEPGLDSLRVLVLGYVMQRVRLLHVVDGRLEATDGSRDVVTSERGVDVRSELATALWGDALVASDHDEIEVVRAVGRVLLELVEGGRLTTEAVRRSVADDDVADEVLVRLRRLTDDGAVHADGDVLSVVPALRSVVAMMLDEAVVERWGDLDQ